MRVKIKQKTYSLDCIVNANALYHGGADRYAVSAQMINGVTTWFLYDTPEKAKNVCRKLNWLIKANIALRGLNE